MKQPNRQIYLGDSVYAETDGYEIELFLNNGERNNNGLLHKSPIFLDLDTQKAIVRLIKGIGND